jgi:hypothetical protein
MALIAIASMALGRLAIADRLQAGIAHSAVTLCLAIVLTTVAGFLWDRRSSWTTFVETTETPPLSLTSLLPKDQPIFAEDVTIPWLLLKQSSYFSCDQGTGVLFSRGTAIAFGSRFQSFRPLHSLDVDRDKFCRAGKADESALPLGRKDLSSACRREPGLGALVLTRAATDVPARVWISPAEYYYSHMLNGNFVSLSTDRFFIYSCSDLRV